MSDKTPRFILANGERFVTAITKNAGGKTPDYPRSYEEARVHLKNQIGASLDALHSLPAKKRTPGEAVLCLRMHPDLIAKSYDPQVIFQQVAGLEKVGSRSYRQPVDRVARTKKIQRAIEKEESVLPGRLVFVSGSERVFQELVRKLDRAESSVLKKFQTEIRRIESFDLLSEEEQLGSFSLDPDWTHGRVEFVLHPSHRSTDHQLDFFKGLFASSRHSLGKLRHADYPGGPMFISGLLHRDDLLNLAGANPLRTAHPMEFKGFETMRASPMFKAPIPPVGQERSTIKVGVFDGGLDPDHPLLKGHVEHDESLSIAAAAVPDGLAHGTAVAGAVLYGPLNYHDLKNPLPSPLVSVISFRVLPTSDPMDIDLYESIDVIENVVPARKDILVYNISFGPRGPIDEDSISRFTYVLDSLAHDHQVTFCVAVGNDGEAGPDLGRIQAPSDLVNGLGIGAYTERKGKRVAADYSCVGPGRECAKLKPDLVAFGGCDQTPIHLVSTDHSSKVLAAGTSFSSPLVASLAAQAVQGMERGSSLLARTLLIHGAEHPDESPDHSLGHGIVSKDLESLLACGKNEVSILFQNSVEAKHSVKLPLLLPENLVTKGKLKFRWTIGILPQVDANQASEYTKVCIQDTFYPHSYRVRFSPPAGIKQRHKVLHLLNDADEARYLLAQGWKKSGWPVSESGNDYLTESKLRGELKWEPVVRKRTSKQASSIEDPFLVLHAIPRGGATGKVAYAVVVTITATQDVDIYQAILQKNPVLQPVRLRSETELRVRI